MELGHLLISRVMKQRPSHDLEARFALYVLDRLPGGFVIDSDDLWRWVRVAGDADNALREPRRRPSWVRRLRAGFGSSLKPDADA
jgi:hypothetical protein